ncbi:hypothetical protein ACROYT_G021495 [Oculina patagonica]
MSHFSKGSEKPAHKGEGLRLYNMRFCPFAQRARLVLRAKGIEFESVNINLGDKPEWFLDLNPAGKVPVIELPDGKVISESAICCEFLEDMYPEKAQLCPKDAFEKHKQRILVEVLGSKQQQEEELDNQLAAFDKELKDRNSKFIGGETSSMADYLMWPWIERLYKITELRERHVSKFPVLSAWCAAMTDVPAVKEDSYPAEWHKKFFEESRTKNPDAQLIGIEEKA